MRSRRRFCLQLALGGLLRECLVRFLIFLLSSLEPWRSAPWDWASRPATSEEFKRVDVITPAPLFALLEPMDRFIFHCLARWARVRNRCSNTVGSRLRYDVGIDLLSASYHAHLIVLKAEKASRSRLSPDCRFRPSLLQTDVNRYGIKDTVRSR